MIRALLVAGLLYCGSAQAGVEQWLADRLLQPAPTDPTGWTGSTACRTCHRDHHRSWRRTFHRTMTQHATPATVLGRFDGAIVDYWGERVRPVREGEQFFLEYLAGDRVQRRLSVDRTVGSRRYQQYFTRQEDSGNYWRLPLLWHVGEQRWLHLNGVFLGNDDQEFEGHRALWNQNCIFCHNTGPEPGIDNLAALQARSAAGERIDWATEPVYQSDVAELGIACESCHGPGQEHARQNRNPIRRYLLQLSDRADPTIVNPTRLTGARSSDLCGQCHGQRLPLRRGDLFDWLDTGPSFRAGQDLAAHVEPIRIDTQSLPGTPADQFALRFWSDGTPRLTAYEFQGMTDSACFQSGELSCITCHSGHRGDPAGMIEEENRGNTPCLGCHAEFQQDLTAHTRHEPESSGSLCYNCHMPRLAYGVMEIHRSHRIEVPDAAAAARAGRPDACTNCHVDRSSDWAAAELAAGWGLDGGKRGSEMPRLVETLLTGDPVQRAVAGALAGRIEEPTDRRFLTPFLILTLGDDYPMLRWFARRSLLALYGEDPLVDGLADWDYIADPMQRQPLVDTLFERWRALDKSDFGDPPPGLPMDADFNLDPDRVAELIRLRVDREIEIGE